MVSLHIHLYMAVDASIAVLANESSLQLCIARQNIALEHHIAMSSKAPALTLGIYTFVFVYIYIYCMYTYVYIYIIYSVHQIVESEIFDILKLIMFDVLE